MINPLETLRKILALEEKDYDFQDKAVAGGLARYVATWRKQAIRLFGETANTWIDDVASRLEAYSSLQPEARRQALQTLLEVLEASPQQKTSSEAVPSVPQPAVKKPPTPVQSAAKSRKGLAASVKVLSGVGPRRVELLEKLGVKTVGDFLYFYPRRYEDYSQLKTIDHLEYGEIVSIIGTVWEAGGRQTRGGRYLFRAILSDATGTLEITWFNQRYLEGRIKSGMQIVVSGKVDEYLGRLTMNAPEWEVIGRSDLETARIVPIYSMTEGLTQRWLRRTIKQALSAWASRIPDPLPASLRAEKQLLPLDRALWGIHLPDSSEHLQAARRRLAFEEALYLQLGLLRQKFQWKSRPGRVVRPASGYVEAVLESLPYALTGAQRRSLDEMLEDMASGNPMNRLLQGDVGSGKTVVAAVLMAVTAASAGQAALMAPTEILAEQHYQNLVRLFESFPVDTDSEESGQSLGKMTRLLTGSTSNLEREEIYAGLEDGSVRLVIGTHALIQENVAFKDLDLVVIDEQHRFGVAQRETLRQKGHNPHLLVMTATPIPRSLELTVWGNLDVSILDEMPPGRQAVETKVLYAKERERAYSFVRQQVLSGRQAFIIYPLVEASDKIAARSAVEEHERLQSEVFPNFKLGLLHGRLRPDEKDAVMGAFVRGEFDILVATSVVEVGIDVPNATVMLIDGAERFGLAQLHQFRGRVGRGEYQSYCLLIAGDKLTAATERLKAVESTVDGFVLAQKDLDLRGPGEFLGTRQSGFPDLPMATWTDTRLLHEVREAADRLLREDPELASPGLQDLAQCLDAFWHTSGELN